MPGAFGKGFSIGFGAAPAAGGSEALVSSPTSTTPRTFFNDQMLVFNTQQSAWMKWNGLNPDYLRDTFDSDGNNRVFLGDDHGYVYRIDRGGTPHDGVQGVQTTNLTSTLTSGNSTSIACSGSSFATTPGDALKGVLVRITHTTSNSTAAETTHLARIFSNDSANLTISPGTPGTFASGDQYAIGGIDAFWVSKWLDFGTIVNAKNMHRVELILSEVSNGSINTDDQTDWNTTFIETNSTLSGSRQEIDVHIRRKFKALRIRLRGLSPGEFFEIVSMALRVSGGLDDAGRQTDSFSAGSVES